MEKLTYLNFSIPTSLSLKIDKLRIELKENHSIEGKTKAEFLAELMALGYLSKNSK